MTILFQYNVNHNNKRLTIRLSHHLRTQSYYFSTLCLRWTTSLDLFWLELRQLEDLQTSRITRVVTVDFPQYLAVVSRLRQEVHAVGPEGGVVSSTAVPQVQALFPPNALTKKIRVGLQVSILAFLNLN